MRHFLLLLLGVLSPNWATAQSFQATPAPLLEQEVALEQATECYIFFENPGGDSLQLRWKKLDASFPSNWDIDLCDFGICYVGIPASGLMNPASGDEQPYLKLIVQPGSTSGAGWFWFRVWEEGNSDNFEDVYFSLNSPGVTATQEAEPLQVRLFPNPVSTFLFLENTTAQPIPAKLLNTNGRQIWVGTLPAGQRSSIDCSAWPKGSYFLQTTTASYTIIRIN